MSSSKEAILMSKLGRKKAPFLSAADTSNDGSDFRGIKGGVKDPGPGLSANTGGSLEVLRATKAGNIGGKLPTVKTGNGLPHPAFDTVDTMEENEKARGMKLESPEFYRKMRGEESAEIQDNKQLKAKKMPYSPIKNYLKKGK